MMKKVKTVLIFGGSGFFGLGLARSLSALSYMRTVVADIKPPAEKLPGRIDYIRCDILEEDAVMELCNSVKPDVIYNLAGFAHLDTAIKHPKLTFELNVIGNINILNGAASAGVRLFAYASSAYAMSDKGSFYGISKLASEKIVEEFSARHGLNYVILRYGSIYAAADYENNYLYQLVKGAIQTGKINHVGDGEELREYIHVKDVSRLSMRIIEDESLWNSAIMLTGNERMKRREVFAMIQEIVGSDRVEISYGNGGATNHYKLTPYAFQGTSAQKLTANPFYDLGQGILECVSLVMQSEESSKGDV